MKNGKSFQQKEFQMLKLSSFLKPELEEGLTNTFNNNQERNTFNYRAEVFL